MRIFRGLKNRIPYVFLSTLMIGSMISINALKVEGFTIDTILDEKKNRFTDETYYVLPSDTVINLSDNKRACPSGQCEFIMQDIHGGNYLDFTEEGNFLSLTLQGRLKDDITHADLGPKKQKLVEGIGAYFPCSFTDIIEETGKTKYICDNQNGTFKLYYNLTFYDYDFSGSFELPSRHLSLNASAIEQ